MNSNMHVLKMFCMEGMKWGDSNLQLLKRAHLNSQLGFSEFSPLDHLLHC